MMMRAHDQAPGFPFATVSAMALMAWLGCSNDAGDTTDSAALGNRPTTAGGAGGASAGAVGSAGATAAAPPASGGATSSEGNPTPAGPVTGNTPTASAGETPLPTPDAGVAAAPACSREQTDANKATVATAIDELFVQGDITAADRYWAEPYLQHNPGVASGVTTFRTLFGGLVSPGNSVYDLSRIVGECDLVLIQGDYISFGGPTFDMFRVADGHIVEHWDSNATAAGPNPSGHTALDGPSTVEDINLGPQNEARVLELFDQVLIPANLDRIADYLSPDLIEHDPDSTDGSAAFAQNLQARAITYQQVHHDIADGNFVFVLSEGTLGATPVAHYDLYRLANNQIVEHWIARRPVPATTASGLPIF